MFRIKARIKEIKAIKRGGGGGEEINNAKHKRANLSTCAGSSPRRSPPPVYIFTECAAQRGFLQRRLRVTCSPNARSGCGRGSAESFWLGNGSFPPSSPPSLFATHRHGWPHGGERGIQQKVPEKKKGDDATSRSRAPTSIRAICSAGCIC